MSVSILRFGVVLILGAITLPAQFSNVALIADASGHVIVGEEITVHIFADPAHVGEAFWIYPTLNTTPITFGSPAITAPTSPDSLFWSFQGLGWNLDCGGAFAPSWCLTGTLSSEGYGQAKMRLPGSFVTGIPGGTFYWTGVTISPALGITGITQPIPMRVWWQFPQGQYIPGDIIIPSANLPPPLWTNPGTVCSGPQVVNEATFFDCNLAGYVHTEDPVLTGTLNMSCLGTQNGALYELTLQEILDACAFTGLGGGHWVDFQFCSQGGFVEGGQINLLSVFKQMGLPYYVLDKFDCHPVLLCGACEEVPVVPFGGGWFGNGFIGSGCTGPAIFQAKAGGTTCFKDLNCQDLVFIEGFRVRIDCCQFGAIVSSLNAAFPGLLSPSTVVFSVGVADC